MITVHLYDSQQQQWRSGDLDILTFPLAAEQKAWLDVSNATVSEQTQLLAQLGLHPVLAEDFLRERHPPKLEVHDDYTLLILRAFVGADFFDYPGHAQLSLIFSKQFLLYKWQLPLNISEQTLPRLDVSQPFSPIKEWVKHYIHAVSASYLAKLINFEDTLSDFEDQMLDKGDDQKMTKIMRYRSVFRKLDRNLAYQKEMFAEVLLPDSAHPFKSQFHRTELRDFYERFERLHSMTQMYYDQLGDLLSGYMSSSSHQINERMKVLTMVSTVFIPLTFIVGIYGMNFENMPELATANGYYWVLGGMLILALAMMATFKIKRWW